MIRAYIGVLAGTLAAGMGYAWAQVPEPEVVPAEGYPVPGPALVDAAGMQAGDVVFRQAERLFANGEEALARAQYEKAIELYEKAGHREGEARARRAVADMAAASGTEDAAPMYAKAAELFGAVGNARAQAQCLVRQGECVEPMDVKTARGLFLAAGQLFAAAGDVKGEAESVWKQAGTHRPGISDDGDWLFAEALYARAGELFQKAGALEWQGRCYTAAGNCFFEAQAHTSALECYTRAIDVLMGAGDRTHLAAALYGKGVAAKALDQPAAAVPSLEQAAAIYAQTGATNRELRVVVAQVECVAATNLSFAVPLYERAEQLAGALGLDEERAETLMQLGLALRKDANPRGDWKRSAQVFEDAGDVFTALGNEARATDALYEQAFSTYHAGWYRKSTARVLFLRAAKRYRERGDEENAARAEQWYRGDDK